LFYIKKFVKEGGIVYTDCWKKHSGLSRNGYVHRTVNHSLNFVNPINRTHAQYVESYCVMQKLKIKKNERS